MPPKNNLLGRIWKFLVSVKLTIILLIVLAIVSIIGTVIPQNQSPNEYLRLYSKSTYNLFKSAGFLDLYHAWWFLVLLASFTINLIACSINRLPRVLKLLSKSDTVLDESDADNFMCVKKITFKTHSKEKEKNFGHALKEFLKEPATVLDSGKRYFFSEKGRYSCLAFYLTHLGLIIIVIGVLLGTLGYQGFMQIYEGETVGAVTLRKSYNLKKLPFAIRCDKFEVTYYDKSQRPKDYKSTLTIIEEGKEVLTKVIEVNDPLIHHGIYFYQSSYGAGSSSKAEMLLGIKNNNSGQAKNYRIKTGQRFTIKGTNDAVIINRLLPDFTMNDKGQPISRSSQPNNPALHLTVYPDGNQPPYSTWVFAKFPDFHKKPDSPYNFSFIKLFPQYYTGLQVTMDPGVEIVWLGCILATVGMYFAFFVFHRRVWLTIEEKEGSFKAVLAGTSSKNKDDFKKDFNKLFNRIKSIGETQC